MGWYSANLSHILNIWYFLCWFQGYYLASNYKHYKTKMVKTKAKWFAKEPERKVRINAIDLAVLTLRGTKFSNETQNRGWFDCFYRSLHSSYLRRLYMPLLSIEKFILYHRAQEVQSLTLEGKPCYFQEYSSRFTYFERSKALDDYFCQAF